MDHHILAIETSSSCCGAALLSVGQGRTRVLADEHNAVGEHAQRLLPMIEGLLERAGIERGQLTAVAFGQGPGGFTGLRVACGVAQGIAFALDIPVVPIVSLLAVAARDHARGQSPQVRVVVQDARMGEVYLAAYRPVAASTGDAPSWRQLQAPILLNAADAGGWIQQNSWRWPEAVRGGEPLRLVGDALDAYAALRELGNDAGPAASSQTRGAPATVLVQTGPPLRADAPAVAELAWGAWQRGAVVTADFAAPLYVRDKVAFTTLERERGLGGNPAADAPPVSIEPMTLDSLDEVVEIERTAQPKPWTHGNFSDALQAGYGAWVARRGEKILGFYLTMFAPDVAHLLLIAVAHDQQRQGIGSLFLLHCEREAKARSLPSLILEVRPSNRNAIAFYQHRGFAQISVRKGYYADGKGGREDAWVLQKKLVPGPEDAHG